MGRIRQATDINLPTSGHVISHNSNEIRGALENQDLTNILVLDDTSFSGSTSLIFERLIRAAFPERNIDFTHGFLILNTGNLGLNHGAKQRLEANGDMAIGGLSMSTPKDDGWHFFDLVKQEHITDHLEVVRELLLLLDRPNFHQLASTILADQNSLNLMFPKLVSTDDLEKKRATGHFIGSKKLNGEFHVRNPQLLPNIIGQNHISNPNQWRGNPEDAFALLIKLNKLLKEGKNE